MQSVCQAVLSKGDFQQRPLDNIASRQIPAQDTAKMCLSFAKNASAGIAFGCNSFITVVETTEVLAPVRECTRLAGLAMHQRAGFELPHSTHPH